MRNDKQTIATQYELPKLRMWWRFSNESISQTLKADCKSK